jgi:hypothetical protein
LHHTVLYHILNSAVAVAAAAADDELPASHWGLPSVLLMSTIQWCSA